MATQTERIMAQETAEIVVHLKNVQRLLREARSELRQASSALYEASYDKNKDGGTDSSHLLLQMQFVGQVDQMATQADDLAKQVFQAAKDAASLDVGR